MSNLVGTAPEWVHTSVALATNLTTIATSPVLYAGVVVTSVMSAHALLITDGSTVVDAVPATSAAGTNTFSQVPVMMSALYIDPNDAATGTVSVRWKYNHDGVAGSGHS